MNTQQWPIRKQYVVHLLEPSFSDCSLPAIPSTDDTASTSTSAALKEEGAASAVKAEDADLIKNMQFSHMTSCTFNINVTQNVEHWTLNSCYNAALWSYVIHNFLFYLWYDFWRKTEASYLSHVGSSNSLPPKRCIYYIYDHWCLWCLTPLYI